MDQQIWLIPMGFVLGTIGTLIGAGGGFILVPVLLLIYPNKSPESITSISLAVVFLNALSGSAAYARLRRIDYKSGFLLAIATVPGAVFGALTTDLIPRRTFNGIFGVLIIVLALYILFHRDKKTEPLDVKKKAHTKISIVEKDGTKHTFSYDLRLGAALSTLVGYASSLLGIGGGVIHVPILVRLLNFPVHIATATSHFILAIMALAGTIVHIAKGSFTGSSVYETVLLGVGVLFGAQLGAWLSGRIRGDWIIRALALALSLVGIRILIMVFKT
ncbi:MAG: sulfite exporter TauE/SafE family protein [Candidatus Latescibacteria bacterium]|nr:sulfite exporter TauE/SafE family protein [Candidatus Latescibacterota bacterium]